MELLPSFSSCHLAFSGVIIVLWIIWRKKHLAYFKKLGIPGPKPNLLFGNLIELYRKGPLKCHEEWTRKYGRIVGYFYGMRPVLLISDRKILKNVFIKDFPKFMNREAVSPILYYDPLDESHQAIHLLRGKKWKDVRSVLVPTFTAAKMKEMSGSMNSSIEILLRILKEKAETGEVIDLWDIYQRFTLDIITRTAFGIRTDVQTDSKLKLLRHVQILFRLPYKDIFTFVGLSFPYTQWLCYKAQEMFYGILNAGSSPRDMLNKSITKVLDYRRSHQQVKRIDLLQLMIDSKIPTGLKELGTKLLEIGDTEQEEKLSREGDANKSYRRMTDSEIKSSASALLLAGYETTSTALSFASYLIAKHQDVQQRVYEEIRDVTNNGQNLEYGTISKLHYLDKVLNECLRVYPPVTLFTSRFASEDVQYGDLKIPKGTLILAPTYLIHHDPELWDNPEKFDPDRFEKKANRKDFAYFPFGIGPRNCIGMRFAQMEVKFALATVLNMFKITLANETEEMELFEKLRNVVPKNGVNVKFELRQDD